MKYREISRTELNEIIEKHELWLQGKDGGERADLSYCIIKEPWGWDERPILNVNLSYANLEGGIFAGAMENVDLMGVNARGADLSECDFFRNNLSGSDFSYSKMIGTMITDSILEQSDFRCSDMRKSRISGCRITRSIFEESCLFGIFCEDCDFDMTVFPWANMACSTWLRCKMENIGLEGADLRMAKFIETNPQTCLYGISRSTSMYSMACPEEGSFIGFKNCGDDVILKLKITEDSKRSSATSRACRCSKAEVLSITFRDGTETEKTVVKDEDNFEYRLGEIIEVPDFDENRWNEKGNGIIFFITREEAVNCTLF